jgi:hypothetical protein
VWEPLSDEREAHATEVLSFGIRGRGRKPLSQTRRPARIERARFPGLFPMLRQGFPPATPGSVATEACCSDWRQRLLLLDNLPGPLWIIAIGRFIDK